MRTAEKLKALKKTGTLRLCLVLDGRSRYTLIWLTIIKLLLVQTYSDKLEGSTRKQGTQKKKALWERRATKLNILVGITAPECVHGRMRQMKVWAKQFYFVPAV